MLLAAPAQPRAGRHGVQVVPARAASVEARAAPEQLVLPPSPTIAVATESGWLLTCAEIRGMDEVELITDDSYCR
jgi:hypothetical protein